MQDKILNKVEECFLIAEKFYGKTFDRPTKIIFKRDGSSAGRCLMSHNYSRRELVFQLDLAEHNPNDAMNTVIHEVAHYIQFIVYGFSKDGISPHGREWKFVMRQVFNESPTRCHNYDMSVTNIKRQTTHLYGCGCGKEFNLSQTMHNKILRGNNRICGSCRGLLILKKMGNPYEQKLQAMLKQLEAKSKLKTLV